MDLQPVKNFIASPSTNEWLLVGPFEVYVRKAFHNCEGNLRKTFDIANITRDAPDDLGGRGDFWKFVEDLRVVIQNMMPEHTLYVETVQNSRLATSLAEHGWFRASDIDPPSFYLP